ncbi:MAG: phosphoglycolate phosphatase [Betaproteobacteria bacterium RIFCSPLOWO2_12_FULL_62_13]|nr:MAG: phosphoglycolate phosphatase [Betaproteobacteria bacterium RIFCSPLOWO2_12_FULL_62_13]
MIKAVLFDLDGTFADTAADLGFALNRMREARGLAPLPVETTRPVTSLGARGLLSVGFGITPEHADYHAMRGEFLEVYEQNLCRHTRLFPGISELLDAIEVRQFRWGIVTNKAERFAKPLLELLHVGKRAACVIGGDTTGKIKPHPAPLLAASHMLATAPQACVYVGDDRRDIEAGHAAGMMTVAVKYGYLNGGEPESWGADAVIERPQELLRHL